MSYIEINQQAYFHNLERLCAVAGSKDKVAVVLKDNAYGHGLKIMGELAARYGIKRAVVRYLHEAQAIENFFDEVLVLSDIGDAGDKMVLTVNRLDDIASITAGKVALKVDSGMHRNGISVEEMERAFEMIASQGLMLHSVFTHYRSADELSSELFWQLKNFDRIKERTVALCRQYGIKEPLFHSCNSAALMRLGRLEDDFARVGIAGYGYSENDLLFSHHDLRPVMSLWGEKMATRFLKKGERVGYGGTYSAPCDMFVSTYDIGYGDGFMRFNGVGEFEPKEGVRVLGRVSMDSLSVEGDSDRVCLFDDAKKISQQFDTISYDVLVKLSQDIKRVVV
jgi:alanine racemase